MKWNIWIRQQRKEDVFVLNFRFRMQNYDESLITFETEINVNYI